MHPARAGARRIGRPPRLDSSALRREGRAHGSEDADTAAPTASAFPTADGTLEQIARQGAADERARRRARRPATTRSATTASASASSSVDRTQIDDADVAIYAAHGPTGKAEGPYPGQVESLATEPAFTAADHLDDPDAAKAVYVTDIPFDQPGEWR